MAPFWIKRIVTITVAGHIATFGVSGNYEKSTLPPTLDFNSVVLIAIPQGFLDQNIHMLHFKHFQDHPLEKIKAKTINP